MMAEKFPCQFFVVFHIMVEAVPMTSHIMLKAVPMTVVCDLSCLCGGSFHDRSL